MSLNVPRTTRSSGQLARMTNATGQSGTIVWQELGNDCVDGVDGEVDGQC